jgi:uncharacterized protein YaaN involved in tellurite resistance
MDSGFQKNKNRNIIWFINDLQRQIFEITFQIKELDDQIFEVICDINNYESLPELAKTRKLLRTFIHRNILIIEQLKKDLVIC